VNSVVRPLGEFGITVNNRDAFVTGVPRTNFSFRVSRTPGIIGAEWGVMFCCNGVMM